MSANPRAIWKPTPAEVLLAELHELSRSKSQMLAFDTSPNALLPQSTDYPPTLLKVQSMEDTMSPKLNESPFQSQFPYVSPIPGNSTMRQTTLNDSPTTGSVRGSLSTTHLFSVAPILATPPSTVGQTALLSQQHFPSSRDLAAPVSVQLSPNISVSIPASLASSPVSTQASFLSCHISGCLRTFTHNHEYNRHKKSHTHPDKCQHCGRGFETPKDVKRHINDVHETTRRYFCIVSTCRYSRSVHVERKGFSRKENWRRHMRTKHNVEL